MYLNPKGRIKIKSIADDKNKQSIVCYSSLIVVFVFTSVNGLWILFGKIKKNPPKNLHYDWDFFKCKKITNNKSSWAYIESTKENVRLSLH